MSTNEYVEFGRCVSDACRSTLLNADQVPAGLPAPSIKLI